MRRRDILLSILGAAGGRSYTPAQLQKAVFLVSRNLPDLVSEGPKFNFVPYDYGPFDRAVYDETANLRDEGFAEIAPSGFGRWSVYLATDEGVDTANDLLDQMESDDAEYIREVSSWVRAQSFTGLVRSIYEAYPEMRENSIFQD